MRDIEKTRGDLQAFWDNAFAEETPEEVQESDLGIEGSLEKALLQLSQKAKRILDLGCGEGTMLLKMGFHSPDAQYLGIDASPHAIALASKMAELAKLQHLQFRVGGLKEVQELAPGSFDGILSSNFLDVIPFEDAQVFAHEITRLLAPGGLFVLKVNFLLSREFLEKRKCEVAEDGGVFMGGILRSNNRTSAEWIALFQDLRLLEEGEYARLKNGPLDRLFVFEKPVKRDDRERD